MAHITLSPPFDTMSGKLARRDKIVLRHRNGRVHAYAIQHPYDGPTAPARQRTLDAFAAAVARSKTILHDPALRAEWEQRFAEYTERTTRYPTTYPRPCTTLRGYIISTLTREAQSSATAPQPPVS